VKKRDYSDYLQDMLTSLDDIESFAGNMSFDAFKGDKKTVYAVVRCIEVLGEAAKKIPRSVRDRYPDMPWEAIVGMRNKLIHEYFGVDIQILWETVRRDIPSLKPVVRKLVRESE